MENKLNICVSWKTDLNGQKAKSQKKTFGEEHIFDWKSL